MTTDDLDRALSQLESLSDGFHQVLMNFEQADEAYERDWLTAFARAKGAIEARKAEAKQVCIDTGVSGQLRAARAKLEAHKARTRITIAVLDGLRSRLSAEKVGV